MSFKEVKELRNNGELEKALETAQNDLARNENDIWSKRSLAWVYYDYLKKNAEEVNYKEFSNFLERLAALDLPEDEKMIFDQASWQIGKLINQLNYKSILREDIKSYIDDSGRIEISILEKTLFNYRTNLLGIIKTFHFTKPSESYSFLLKMFMKNSSSWHTNEFIDFADWWDFDNFMNFDYQKRLSSDGKPYMSLAEQAYINYSKFLLQGTQKDSPEEVLSYINRINQFLPKLDLVIEKNPEWDYAIYYKAKLLIKIERHAEVRGFVMPFVKRKRNEFWVWDLLSESYPDNIEMKIACLCKAAMCDAEPTMKAKVHNKLEKLLMIAGKNEAAEIEGQIATELKKVIRARLGFNSKNEESQEDAKVSGINESTAQSSSNASEYLKLEARNLEFYKQYQRIAEEQFFNEKKPELAIVEFVNRDKKILNFVINKEKAGFFNYSKFLKKVNIGDRLLVRLEGSGINVPYKVLTLEITDQEPGMEVMKAFDGVLNKNENQPFGFVGDVFIDFILISREQLNNGSSVTGTAIISFNRKKSNWGWKAIDINLR